MKMSFHFFVNIDMNFKKNFLKCEIEKPIHKKIACKLCYISLDPEVYTFSVPNKIRQMKS